MGENAGDRPLLDAAGGPRPLRGDGGQALGGAKGRIFIVWFGFGSNTGSCEKEHLKVQFTAH